VSDKKEELLALRQEMSSSTPVVKKVYGYFVTVNQMMTV
jgi:hypothetical protein